MKGNLLQGTARGRMGEVVASVRHGKQLFSKYQPNVNNPKSPKQASVRLIFAMAVKFTRNFLVDNLISNTYALLSGSARSMFININRLAINSTNTIKGAVGYLQKLANPLMIKNINENQFSNQFENVSGGLVPFINGVKLAANKLYFGSITEFKGKKMVVKAIATDSQAEIGLKDYKDELALTKSIVSPENERMQGFQTSSANCGNWPYVYEITLPATFILTSAEPSELAVEEEALKVCHLIYTTNLKEMIGYDVAINPTLEP